MDVQKTGILISEVRKEKGLTQKQLAEQLHVSDRTISKWERGAGFPDISLLEPLANALDVSVTGLLQGERIPAAEADFTVRNAIAIVYKQMKARTRKRVGTIAASIILTVFFAGFIFASLDYSGAFLKDVEMEIPVGVYIDGTKVDESSVAVSGKRNTVTLDRFTGKFAVAYVGRTCRDGVTACIDWDDPAPGYESISYHAFGGAWESGVQRNLYISEDMTQFALILDDGVIIATDEYYVPLLMLDQYYPLAS
ncbi:MAG: helix-turn-helix domain-containing protein [Oscillospiraceae bacterium]